MLTGEADGRLGSATRAAVKQAQIKVGLPADAYPTPGTDRAAAGGPIDPGGANAWPPALCGLARLTLAQPYLAPMVADDWNRPRADDMKERAFKMRSFRMSKHWRLCRMLLRSALSALLGAGRSPIAAAADAGRPARRGAG